MYSTFKQKIFYETQICTSLTFFVFFCCFHYKLLPDILSSFARNCKRETFQQFSWWKKQTRIRCDIIFFKSTLKSSFRCCLIFNFSSLTILSHKYYSKDKTGTCSLILFHYIHQKMTLFLNCMLDMAILTHFCGRQ